MANGVAHGAAPAKHIVPGGLDKLRKELLPLLVLSRLWAGIEKSASELSVDAEKFATFPQFMGSFLPLLFKMELRGLLDSRWIAGAGICGRRKLYRLTAQGEITYHEGIRDLERTILRLRLSA